MSHSRIFVFSCILFSKKRSVFAPQGTWAPNCWVKKVELSTGLAGGARSKLCPLVSCWQFVRSAKSFDCFAFTAHRDSFWITLVYSEFLCFPASTLWSRGVFPNKKSKSWLLGWKSNVLPAELAMLGERIVTLFVAVILNVLPTFFDCYTFTAHLDFFWSRSSTRSFFFSCFHFCEKGYFSPHKGLEPLTVGSKLQRSTEWASGARKEACHIASCC